MQLRFGGHQGIDRTDSIALDQVGLRLPHKPVVLVDAHSLGALLGGLGHQAIDDNANNDYRDQNSDSECYQPAPPLRRAVIVNCLRFGHGVQRSASGCDHAHQKIQQNFNSVARNFTFQPTAIRRSNRPKFG
jgi:hypothetical protein